MATEIPLFELLCCPETQQPLRPLEESRLDELNAAIRAGEVQCERGDDVDETLDAALLREDEAFVYPVRDGVPNLLIGDRIPL